MMFSKEKTSIEKGFEFGFLLLLLILFFYLIKPFLLALLLATLAVFVTYKPYQWLVSKLHSKSFSAFIVVLGVTCLILFPLYYTFIGMITESSMLINTLGSTKTNVSLSFCSFQVCRTIEKNIQYIHINSGTVSETVVNWASNSIGSLVQSISNLFLNILIFLIAFFTFLTQGPEITRYIKRLIPMKTEYKEILFLRFEEVTVGVFLSYILVGIIQGVLMGIMIWILGLPSPLFWAFVTAVVSSFPFLGPFIVYIPLSLYLFALGRNWSAIILLIIGVIIISECEDILKPLFMKNKMKVHFLLIILAIVGGISAFGVLGFFIGPLIISLLVTVISLYKLDFE